MNFQWYNNGIVIQGLTQSPECYDASLGHDYIGLERFLTDPLEQESDIKSMQLTNEITEYRLKKWGSAFTITNQELLFRYISHCNEQNLPIRCIQIESEAQYPFSDIIPSQKKFLGYEYVDTDMQTSCSYEDLCMDPPYIGHAFDSIIHSLNEYGLFNTLTDIQKYIDIRLKLVKQGYDMEEYFNPQIVKLYDIMVLPQTS